MRAELLDSLKLFIKGYEKRDENEIELFMNLFSNDEDVQMLGISATQPESIEWFTGKEEIKEIILSDWKYWGMVHFDLENIRITEKNDVAWFTLCATLEQLEVNETSWNYYADQMREIIEDSNMTAHDRMFEAAHFGMRRVREKNLGVGYKFPMVITGVLVKDEIWKFHTLHWSMPVD